MQSLVSQGNMSVPANVGIFREEGNTDYGPVLGPGQDVIQELDLAMRFTAKSRDSSSSVFTVLNGISQKRTDDIMFAGVVETTPTSSGNATVMFEGTFSLQPNRVSRKQPKIGDVVVLTFDKQAYMDYRKRNAQPVQKVLVDFIEKDEYFRDRAKYSLRYVGEVKQTSDVGRGSVLVYVSMSP